MSHDLPAVEPSLGPGPPLPPPPPRPRRSRLTITGWAVAAVAFVAACGALIAGIVHNSRTASSPRPLPPVAVSVAPPASASPMPSGSSSPGPTLSPAATSTPAPMLASPAAATGPVTTDTASAAAEAVYQRYTDIDNEVGRAGFASAKPFRQVAVDPALTLLTESAHRQHAAGERAVGAATVRSMRVEKVSLRDDSGYYPEVVLLACLDLTHVSGVDAHGKPLSTAHRPDTLPERVTVRRYHPGTPGVPAAGGWYLAELSEANLPPAC